ncbi:hypothetical protein LIER_11942 [Lithospermum erythrorhizon]|uniref:EF-hand domain-containing protein n=1 Tax=Lithospermum erythrorhizon TaxID=34254 RepID=A0AAV3PU84_LITER
MEEEGNLLEKDLEEIFKVFDLNGDGFISSEEIQSALFKLGLSDEDQQEYDCKKMLSYDDTNSDGKIDFQELKHMMSFTR